MAPLQTRREIDVVVDHRLVGLVDQAADRTTPTPAPHSWGGWFSVGPGAVYLESDEDILYARLLLEAWDSAPAFDPAGWDRHGEAEVDLPSGVLDVDMIAAGGTSAVFTVPFAGRWHVRLAWTESPRDFGEDVDLDEEDEVDDLTEPEARALLQFWPS